MTAKDPLLDSVNELTGKATKILGEFVAVKDIVDPNSGDIAKRLTAVEAQVDDAVTVANDASEQASGASSMAEMVMGETFRVNARADEIEGSVATASGLANTATATSQEAIGAVNTLTPKVDKLSEDTTSLSGETSALAQRTTAAETSIREQDTEIKAVKVSLDDGLARVGATETKNTAIEADVADHEIRIAALEGTTSEITPEAFNALKANVNTNTSEIEKLSTRLDESLEIVHTHEGQIEQHYEFIVSALDHLTTNIIEVHDSYELPPSCFNSPHVIKCMNGRDKNITITFPAAVGAGMPVAIIRDGEGRVSIAPSQGTQISSATGYFDIAFKYGVATLIPMGGRKAYLSGQLSDGSSQDMGAGELAGEPFPYNVNFDKALKIDLDAIKGAQAAAPTLSKVNLDDYTLAYVYQTNMRFCAFVLLEHKTDPLKTIYLDTTYYDDVFAIQSVLHHPSTGDYIPGMSFADRGHSDGVTHSPRFAWVKTAMGSANVAVVAGDKKGASSTVSIFSGDGSGYPRTEFLNEVNPFDMSADHFSFLYSTQGSWIYGVGTLFSTNESHQADKCVGCYNVSEMGMSSFVRYNLPPSARIAAVFGNGYLNRVFMKGKAGSMSYIGKADGTGTATVQRNLPKESPNSLSNPNLTAVIQGRSGTEEFKVLTACDEPIDPQKPNGMSGMSLWYSDDSGVSFKRKTKPLSLLSPVGDQDQWVALGGDYWGEGQFWLSSNVRHDPSDPNSGFDTFISESRDYGASWTVIHSIPNVKALDMTVEEAGIGLWLEEPNGKRSAYLYEVVLTPSS